MGTTLRYAIGLSAAVLVAGAAGAAETPAPRIPLVAGLTTVRSVVEPVGDYESIRTVATVGASSYLATGSAEVPDASGRTREIKVARRVLLEDQRRARVMRNYYHVGDPETFPGTTPGISAAVLADLRSTGRANLVYLEVRPILGMPVERRFSGSVARVAASAPTLKMLVNGERLDLPVIHARGKVSDGSESVDLEFHALDDPDNPLLLTSAGPGFSTRITRIEYPLPKGSAASIEQQLAANKPADVYGIYFGFGSATIRPESERVLLEIAALLKAHPDWKLQVDGHTDSIGGDAANLDLSKRRSAAVKAALVQRHGVAAGRLATGGHGAAVPKDRNDNPEGRARNRRVELRRA